MGSERASGEHTPGREKQGWGARLQAARKRAGLTQTEVAIELVSAGILAEPRYQTISEWEREERAPTIPELTWMRERYGFDAEWLVSGREPGWEAAAYRRVRAAVLEIEATAPAEVVRPGTSVEDATQAVSERREGTEAGPDHPDAPGAAGGGDRG